MFRGLDKRHEQDARQLIRDTRTLGQRVYDFFQEPRNIALIFVVAAFAMVFFGAFADIVLLVSIFVFIYTYKRRVKLPFRMPMRSNLTDYNDLKPGSHKPNQARGICFFGNDIVTNEELWFNNEDMRTHVLIFGSTGAGKTETLLSLSYNALVQGSGFIYIDGKGDNSLFAKVFSMTRSVGREDDLLVINFMTGARDVTGPQESRLSNTLNPFANGSSSMLSQLVVSLMDSASQSSDGDMWKGRAIGFVENIMRVLVYMRDQGKILLDANTVRNYFNLDRLESITMDKMFPRDGQEPVSLAAAPPDILEPLYNYVTNLPGYNKQKKGKQVSQVLEQHGFITMQLTRVFSSLADTYGHIIRTNLAEVDLKDVVLNRRILVVLLPALEKSPDELSNLGKVIVATLKAMMASGLGEKVEGDYSEVVAKKPTNAPTPFMCIMDEYGYYAVPGFAVVPAQARSLGFSAIFAGQDLPAFQKASKEEALSIGANTNIKIAMKLEDPIETWDFFAKTAGEAYVTKVDAFQTNQQSVFNNYLDTRSASSEKRARIDLMDLKDQGMGEMHIFFQSNIIRAKSFFANPPPVKKMRLNHFLKVEAPDIKELVAFEDRLETFSEMLESGDFKIPAGEKDSTIDTIKTIYQENDDKTFIERGVSSLIEIYNQTAAPVTEEEIVEMPPEIPAVPDLPEFPEPDISVPPSTDFPELDLPSFDEPLPKMDVPLSEPAFEAPPPPPAAAVKPLGEVLTVFNKVQLEDVAKELVPSTQLEAFSSSLLMKANTQNKLTYLLRMFGKGENYAVNVSKELIHDMNIATQYPPVVENPLPVAEVAQIAERLAKSFETMGDSTDDFSGLLDDL